LLPALHHVEPFRGACSGDEKNIGAVAEVDKVLVDDIHGRGVLA
jgi:hypothetical protein